MVSKFAMTSRVQAFISFTALATLLCSFNAYAMDPSVEDPEAQYALGQEFHYSNPSKSRKYYKRAAKQGHAKAQFQLAEIYEGESCRDEAKPTAWGKAFKYYKLAAKSLTDKDTSDIDTKMLGKSQYMVAEMYYGGSPVEKNLDKAYKYYKLAEANGFGNGGIMLRVIEDDRAYETYSSLAEQGDLEAQIKIGKMYARGMHWMDDNGKVDLVKNAEKAFKYLTSASEQGHPESHYLLGKIYEEGASTYHYNRDPWKLEQDLNGALKHYHTAADQGYAEAQWFLSQKYAKGEGVTQDDIQAMKYLRLAAAQMHPAANLKLGLRYEDVEKDIHAALKHYHIAADQGDADAQVMIATNYSVGDFLEKNDPESLNYFELAAKKNHVMAIYHLGLKYCREQDFKKALEYFTSRFIQNYDPSDDQGVLKDACVLMIPDALYFAAQIYKQGLGTEQDLKEALYYYGRSADLGHADAQFEFGRCQFEEGDVETATNYFKLSSDQGNVEAQHWLAEMYETGIGTEQNLALAHKYYNLIIDHKIPLDEPEDSALRVAVGRAFYKQGILIEDEIDTRNYGKPLGEIVQEKLTEADLNEEDCLEDLSNLGTLRFQGWQLNDSSSSR